VRGRVTKAMVAVDASPRNDWTDVKVLGTQPEAGGQRDNPTFGFIYPRDARSMLDEASMGGPDTLPLRGHVAHPSARLRHAHLQLADATPVADKPADDVKPVHKHRVEPH
jgi:hypothetical protein